ncbi:hypothetical protein OIU84_015432 [Salix udensis]|uniref:Sulfotransferase n=1 Tax=Salix udensis TaxID=889485 RepID=A0AAD6JEQ1_9ROSI|nr:hypothetical protein OIU84_015432 [Salix udensis]
MAGDLCFFFKDSFIIKAPKKSPLALRMVVVVFAMVCGVYTCSICLKQIGIRTNPGFLNVEVIDRPCPEPNIEPREIPYVHYPRPKTYSRAECKCNPVRYFAILSMQRSGSGWFETLLNNHTNISSNGEIFSVKVRRSNFSTITETLDKIYNLDWLSSASKNECTAAVGLKWMLNQMSAENIHFSTCVGKADTYVHQGHMLQFPSTFTSLRSFEWQKVEAALSFPCLPLSSFTECRIKLLEFSLLLSVIMLCSKTKFITHFEAAKMNSIDLLLCCFLGSFKGVMRHHEEIVEYFKIRGVSAVFLFRKNLLRRMISILANSYDRDVKPLNGTHKSHVHLPREAEILAKYKALINTTLLIPSLKQVEDTTAKALEYFKSARHIILYYEDMVKNHTKLLDVQDFLKVPRRELKSRQVKIHKGSLSNYVENWDEVQKSLKGTHYESLLSGDY